MSKQQLEKKIKRFITVNFPEPEKLDIRKMSEEYSEVELSYSKGKEKLIAEIGLDKGSTSTFKLLGTRFVA